VQHIVVTATNDCHYINKKCELMLMRCARAYSSFCSQVILVISTSFVAIHSFAAKNRKKNH